MGKPFNHDAYLSDLTNLRDQLKAKLSPGGREPDEGKEPSTSDLAAKIKALKAAHTVEATPQRSRQKDSASEEPVTARIRRRQEQNALSGQVPNPDAAPEYEIETLPLSENDSSEDRAMTFRERIIRERQSNGEGQSPS